ncbi:P-loop containing nucleoside triphosphate hydrolase protein [Cladochytrium replicatum]|nr:P-loop containing nucleoside triphosphate hydrolase protein [Cladochytrium replicatum]
MRGCRLPRRAHNPSETLASRTLSHWRMSQIVDGLVEALGTGAEQLELLLKLWVAKRKFPDEKTPPCPRCVLLIGPLGSGKTTIVHALNNRILLSDGIPKPEVVSLGKAIWKASGDPVEFLCTTIENVRNTSSLLILDDLELIVPRKDADPRIRSQMIRLLRRTGHPHLQKDPGHLIIATTSHLNKIDNAVLNMFQERIVMDPMDTPRRSRILSILTKPYLLATNVRLPLIAASAHGYSLADLCALVRDAHEFSSTQSNDTGAQVIAMDHLLRAISSRASSSGTSGDQNGSLKSNPQSFGDETNQITFRSIGGYDSVKYLLEESFVWPRKYKEVFEACEITPTRGVLLYGPPGTGKTYFAKAVAAESGAYFISLTAPQLLHGEIGGSEKAIASAFKEAREHEPAIIFIDEIDALFSESSGGSNDLVAKMQAQLIWELDALEECGQEVQLLGATNHPENLDRRIFQYGRFDRSIGIFPPNKEERKKILETLVSGYPGLVDLDIQALSEETEGCTAATLKEIVRKRAAAHVLKEVQ